MYLSFTYSYKSTVVNLITLSTHAGVCSCYCPKETQHQHSLSLRTRTYVMADVACWHINTSIINKKGGESMHVLILYYQSCAERVLHTPDLSPPPRRKETCSSHGRRLANTWKCVESVGEVPRVPRFYSSPLDDIPEKPFPRASSSLDVCSPGRGTLSLWGLQTVGTPRRILEYMPCSQSADAAPTQVQEFRWITLSSNGYSRIFTLFLCLFTFHFVSILFSLLLK